MIIRYYFVSIIRYTKQARYQPSGPSSGHGKNTNTNYNSAPKNQPLFGGNSNIAGSGSYSMQAGGVGANSVSSQSNYGYGTGSSNATGAAGGSTMFGGSKLGGNTDLSGKNGPSRFSRLAQFGMGGSGGGAGVDSNIPSGGRHGQVQPLSSGYGQNNSSSITGAGAYGRHKF